MVPGIRSIANAITFSVAGRPRAQPRPRFVGRGRPVALRDRTIANWKDRIIQAARKAMAATESPPFTGAVDVVIRFRFAPPPSRAGAERSRLGQPHTHKPDVDNLEKLVLDALTRAQVFRDDCQVSRGRVSKVWASRSGVDVEVRAAASDTVGGIDHAPMPGWLAAGAQDAPGST